MAASVVYGLAVAHHQNAASFADLPTDAVRALDRAVSIARLEALPLRGNPVGIAWFGVAADYILAPFLVGASSLESLLGRASLFHALLAPLGYALGVALKRPFLGFAWGGFWATLPAFVALSRDYPVNYQTTHWVLAALVCAVFLGRETRGAGRRLVWTWLLLFSASLAMGSHPLALGALPAALGVALVWGVLRLRAGGPEGEGEADPAWRRMLWRGTLLGVVAATLLSAGTYLVANVGPYLELLSSPSQDPQLSMAEALRSSVAALKMLPAALVVPAGEGPALLLLLGVVPAVLLSATRAAAAWIAAWTLLSFLAFSVAGYAASPWHLTPVVHPLLALGFVGWASALVPSPTPSRVRELAHWVLVVGLLALWLPGVTPSPQRTDSSPVSSFSMLADRLLEHTNSGAPSPSYFEAHARCGMDWSPEATLLDLRLRRGSPKLQAASSDAPFIALVENVPALDVLALPGLEEQLRLPNGVVMNLYVAPEAGPWLTRFLGACGGSRPATSLDVPMVVGGPAAPQGFETCSLPAPCPSYRTTKP